ncbi:MAG TPA: DsbA family protein [Noviherbaspirillum sp.]|nr:DsbA family protein [Noviherbaspirillum sp.]
MCSWCYGFGKELSALMKDFPDMPLRIVVGGLRAGNTKVMDEAMKTYMLSHWTRVAAASGLPFHREALSARQGFVYDTEPACRAVVTARLLAPEVELLRVFRAIQHAFYAEGMDVTRGDLLAQVASAAMTEAGFLTDPSRFLAAWKSEITITETRADFDQTKAWGIAGFPALMLQKDEKFYPLASGYTHADTLAADLRGILEQSH